MAERDPILICDDEPRLTLLTSGLLEQRGFDSRVAHDAEQALKLTEGVDSFSLLLLDVNLEGNMSAEQLVATLEQRGAKIPVLLTSGYSLEDVPRSLRDRPSIVGFLGKPYPIDRLVELVQRSVSQADS